MARVEVPIIVTNSSTGIPVSGASAAITFRAGGTAAPWWAAETGGASSTASITTDSAGRLNAWVNRGAYNVTVSGTGISTYTESWDAMPASDGAGDGNWVADGVLNSTKFLAAVQDMLVPVGTILATARSTAPSGYLMCDGGPVSRTTYAALFTAISTAYGAGDGSTTFGVPDLRGRVPVGVDGAAARLASSDALGQSSGAETVTLIPTDIPGFSGTSGTSAGNNPLKVSNATNVTPTNVNKMQPYQIVNYIIKV